jgi:4-hydroxy-tetrahydrodipicolinate reductase
MRNYRMDRQASGNRADMHWDQAFFYASNFSIGVNIMFILNRWLAGVMNKFPDYDVQLSEMHHIHKKDAPSGTAITLAEDILGKLTGKPLEK